MLQPPLIGRCLRRAGAAERQAAGSRSASAERGREVGERVLVGQVIRLNPDVELGSVGVARVSASMPIEEMARYPLRIRHMRGCSLQQECATVSHRSSTSCSWRS
jgi:hypothetical protein